MYIIYATVLHPHTRQPPAARMTFTHSGSSKLPSSTNETLTCLPSLIIIGMPYPANTPPRQLTPDDSDYGSDFTPEQEALVDVLLAKIDTESASVTPSTPPPLPQPPPQFPRNTATEVAATIPVATQDTIGTQDIEDYYAPQSSPRVPRVLGREKPGTTWQLYKTAGSPWAKLSGAGTGAGPGISPVQISSNGSAELG